MNWSFAFGVLWFSRHKLLKIKTELRTSHGFLKTSENGLKRVGSTERLLSWVEQLLLFWAGSDSIYSPNDLFSGYGSWPMDLFRCWHCFFFLSLSSHSIPWCQRITRRISTCYSFFPNQRRVAPYFTLSAIEAFYGALRFAPALLAFSIGSSSSAKLRHGLQFKNSPQRRQFSETRHFWLP